MNLQGNVCVVRQGYHTWVWQWVNGLYDDFFLVTSINWALIFLLYFKRNSTFNKYKISKTIPRKCSGLFHLYPGCVICGIDSPCELVCEYEVRCTHCAVWREFLHFTLKNKFHEKWNGIFPRWQIVRFFFFFFLASRSHFPFLLRFSWSAYTSFCGLGQIMCQMFEKFCCHTSYIAINSSFQSWRSWEQSCLYKFLSLLLGVTLSSDHPYFLQYFCRNLRRH